MRPLLLALVACSDDPAPGPHDEIECTGYPVALTSCERACADFAAFTTSSCDPGNAPTCQFFSTSDGVGGCCASDDARVARWTECE